MNINQNTRDEHDERDDMAAGSELTQLVTGTDDAQPTDQPADTTVAGVDDLDADSDAQDSDAQDSDDEQPGTDRASRDAAKYRRQLRDTEAQLTTTREQLAAAQRQIAQQLAADALDKPSNLFIDGFDVADLVDDTGRVDPNRVQARVQELAQNYGIGRAVKRVPNQRPVERLISGSGVRPVPVADRFVQAFTPRH